MAPTLIYYLEPLLGFLDWLMELVAGFWNLVAS